MRIGIVVGSIRDTRKAETVAVWAHGQAAARGDAEYEVVDLKGFDVPMLTEATLPMMAGRRYSSPQVAAWSRAVDACDGYVFVTPEYNHGVPGAFKNAIDSLGPEWVGKAVGFVAYGADGGVRCVEHFRAIAANFSMVDVRQQVGLFLHSDFSDAGFTPLERRAGELATLLDQLVDMTGRLRR